MNIEEKKCKIKTAKLAKKKGFDCKCIDYHIDGQKRLENRYYFGKSYNYNALLNIISLPTQALLQKWLRKIHNIDIQVIRNKPGYDEYKVEIYKTNLDSNTYYYEVIADETGLICWFSDYEEALEKGLLKALKLLKDKTNK